MIYDCSKTINYVRERKRMCAYYGDFCRGCPFDEDNTCNMIDYITQEKIDIVQTWANENPVETRQEKFLEQYPTSAIRLDGILPIKPCWIDKKWTDEIACETISCVDCGRKYWNELLR